jgi:uncharacterized protein YkwD
MLTVSTIHLLRLLVLFGGLSATLTTQADALSAVQLLREGGCGGILPAARPLHPNVLLDRAAEQWAAGRSAAAATEHSGYQAQTTVGLHISGPESSTVQLLRRSECRTVTNQSLRDIGVYHRGLDTWLVLASAFVSVKPASASVPVKSASASVPVKPAPVSGVLASASVSAAPASSQPPVLATRVLQLVNDVRARGTRCGERSFGPAPPVRLSGALAGVAFGHAADMARHNYFEHEDLAGRSPADRVRAVGYREKLVGENIAYGPESADEVVQGWLDSPGHCENIMDSRFAEMGIAYAAGHASKRGLYWVQLLAAPRA